MFFFLGGTLISAELQLRYPEYVTCPLQGNPSGWGPGFLSNWVFNYRRFFSRFSGSFCEFEGLFSEFERLLAKIEGFLADRCPSGWGSGFLSDWVFHFRRFFSRFSWLSSEFERFFSEFEGLFTEFEGLLAEAEGFLAKFG